MLSYQNFATFPNLFYLHALCYLINFCRLIKLSSSYPTFVIFSPFPIYSLFTLSNHLINVPAQHIKQQRITISFYLAHALCANTLFQLNRCLWPSCHFDLVDRHMDGGFLEEQPASFRLHRFVLQEYLSGVN